MNAAFAKLNQMLDEFRGSRPPLREHVGSDRRSPSAGPSDIVRPNPIAQVSDSALQGPDSALDLPRLRMSLLPWVLAAMMLLVVMNILSHVVEWTNGNLYAMGVAMCRLLITFAMNWREPTPRLSRLRITSTFVAPVAGRLQITLIVIWTSFNQDMTSLA